MKLKDALLLSSLRRLNQEPKYKLTFTSRRSLNDTDKLCDREITW